MNTTKQAEFLESIMQELDSDPDTTHEEKQLIKVGYAVVKSITEPERIYAGYENGYYFIKINKDVTGTPLMQLRALGYEIKFLEPPFGKLIMLKKRD